MLEVHSFAIRTNYLPSILVLGGEDGGRRRSVSRIQDMSIFFFFPFQQTTLKIICCKLLSSGAVKGQQYGLQKRKG